MPGRRNAGVESRSVMPGGPVPKPDAQRIRRNAVSPMTQLPAEGRKGETPEWPFATQNVRESRYWHQLWQLPQAVVWERDARYREVAFYCRLSIEAEDGMDGALKEMMQVGDRLGCWPLALHRLRWEIVKDEVAVRRETDHTPAPKVKRILAIDKSA